MEWHGVPSKLAEKNINGFLLQVISPLSGVAGPCGKNWFHTKQHDGWNHQVALRTLRTPNRKAGIRFFTDSPRKGGKADLKKSHESSTGGFCLHRSRWSNIFECNWGGSGFYGTKAADFCLFRTLGFKTGWCWNMAEFLFVTFVSWVSWVILGL